VGELNSHPFLRKSSTTSLLARASIALMVIGLAGFPSPGPTVDAARPEFPAPLDTAEINMSTARPVPTRYVGHDGSTQLLEGKQANPRMMAAADFDEDGVPDLVSGYAAGAGGIITLHRGNVDSIFPNTPAAKRRRATGRFSDSPFLTPARVFAAPAAPDFLHAGDFDADGHADVLAAAQGGEALLLRGDGKGGLRHAERIGLPGAVTAMAVGDINGHDGLPDVVFGISRPAGPRALVFAGREGAVKSLPEAFDLPSEATALALGDMDDDHLPDLAVAAGSELLVIRGRDKRSLAETPSRRSLPFTIASMTSGEFGGDRNTDLAVVSQTGEVHLLMNTASAVRNEVAGAGVAGWESDVVAQGVGAGAMRMVRARVANRPTDDLLLVDSSGHRLHILTNRRSAQASARSLDKGGPWNRFVSEGAAVLPMRLNIDARDDLVMLRAGQSAPLVSVTQVGTTFVVTNTNDSGAGSLRQAILDANVSDGTALITFAIPGPGPHTITPLTPLPAANVSEPLPADVGTVIIDGASQPGFAGTPIIELSGAVVGTSGDGLTIGSTGSVVRGLVINRFAVGIRFFEGFFSVIGGSVEGNYIGTDVSGTAALGNSTGLVLRTRFEPPGLVRNVTIGGTVAAARNIISGNGRGIDAELGNLVQGNFIGTDVTGTVALGNANRGVSLISGANGLIGGPAPGARNIISGNGDDGIRVGDGSFLVTNNYIGTDVSGAQALGNSGDGIESSGPEDPPGTISGNVISANGRYGVLALSERIDVLDNRVGTNSAGTEALGNVLSGIFYNGDGHSVTGNVISGNREHGLVLFREGGAPNIVQGNRIGTDITGTAAIGNLGNGVHASGGPNTIGATDSGQGNVIAFNGGDGVSLPASPAAGLGAIMSNAIFSNGGLGIDLGDDGVTPNDACDGDTGANDLQNFPVITAIDGSASSTTIQGQLNSAPSTTYLLQFFSSAAADPSGFGEGARLLGSTTVTTDSTCNAGFAVTLPVAVTAGHFVTATATDPLMRTSEFSNALPFVPQTPQEATRLLIGQVRSLVAQGELNRILGFVLEVRLRVAIFLMDRGHFQAAAQQLRGFNRLVEVFVRIGKLEAAHGQALTDAANAIIEQIDP
jgi:FG-GAP-like repeat